MPVYTTWWRNKFLRSANTMDELIEVLEDAAQDLRDMKAAGVELELEGEDYYLLSTEDPEVAERFGMEEEEDEDEHDCWAPEYGGEG